MGDRANIALKYKTEGQSDRFIFLYTHWSGSELPHILQLALKRGEPRWNDDQYLGRIIFQQLTLGSEEELTGFGLSVDIGDGGNRVIEVDVADNLVQVQGGDKVFTFAEYCTLKFEDGDLSYWDIAGGETESDD